MGWVISQANEWEEYSNYLGEGMDISRNWGTTYFLLLWWTSELSWYLWLCHVAYANIHDERIMRLKVYWKSNHLPSWA